MYPDESFFRFRILERSDGRPEQLLLVFGALLVVQFEVVEQGLSQRVVGQVLRSEKFR